MSFSTRQPPETLGTRKRAHQDPRGKAAPAAESFQPLAIKSLRHPTEASRLAIAVVLATAAVVAVLIAAGESSTIAALLVTLFLFLGLIWLGLEIHRSHLLGQCVRVTRRHVNTGAFVAVAVPAFLGTASGDARVVVQQPPGGSIVFESTRTDSEIWITTPDGTEQRNLTNSPATEDSTPALSPDGDQIAFVRGRRDGNRLWIMNADGSGQRLLAARSRSAFSPVWSPRGDRIAFARRVRGNWDIYIATLDGETRRLTRGRAQEVDVSWNPTGDRLVFDRIARGSSDLWLIGADGGRARRLTRTPGIAELNPDFSPTDDEIAYDALRGRAYDLFALDVSTRRVRRLTHDRAEDSAPAFDPTGRFLAYQRGIGPDYEIAVVDATGSGAPRNVTNAPEGLDLAPSWGTASLAGAALRASLLQPNWVFSCDNAWPGTGGANNYVGNNQINHMCGAGGNDSIAARGAGDWLSGGGGRDTLKGENGNDHLKAKGGGKDAVRGGNGNDAALLDAKDRKASVEQPYY